MAKCKVCDHKKVAEINDKIRKGIPMSTLAGIYGISRGTISKHKKICLKQIIAKDKKEKEEIDHGKLEHEIYALIGYTKKLIDGADQYLTDPEDPDKYFLGARSEEIEVVYRTVNPKTGKTSQIQKKAHLQDLLNVIEGKDTFVVTNVSVKHSDPRDLLLKALTKLENSSKHLLEQTKAQIKWEHERLAIENMAKSGENKMTIEREITILKEKITIALTESNSDELQTIAGLVVSE